MRVPQVSAVVCITVLVFLQTGAVTATTTADCPSELRKQFIVSLY